MGMFDEGNHESPVGKFGGKIQRWTDPMALIFGDKWVDLTSRKIPEWSNRTLSKVVKPFDKIDKAINPARRIPIVDKVSNVVADKPASAIGTVVGGMFALPAMAGAAGGAAGGAGGAAGAGTGGGIASAGGATAFPVSSAEPLAEAFPVSLGGTITEIPAAGAALSSAGSAGAGAGGASAAGGTNWWQQFLQQGMGGGGGMPNLPGLGGGQSGPTQAQIAQQQADERRRQAYATALASASAIRRW